MGAAAARNLRRASYRRALRSHDLRRLLLGNVISGTGSWSYAVALTVFAFERTHSLEWVSAVASARFVPSMLASAYGGLLAERFERARLLAVVNAILALLQVVLAVLVIGRGPVVIALGLAALAGAVDTVSNPTLAALIPQVVREDDLAAANALAGTVDNLVVVAGPSVGAVLLLLGGPVLAVLVDSLSFVAAGILDLRLCVRSRPTDTVLFVAISRDLLETGAAGYGYLLAGLGVGGRAGAAVVNRLAASSRLGPVIPAGVALCLLPDALVLRAGLSEALLLSGLGIPLLGLVTIPWLVRLDRTAGATAAALAPRVALLESRALLAASSHGALERLAAGAAARLSRTHPSLPLPLAEQP